MIGESTCQHSAPGHYLVWWCSHLHLTCGRLSRIFFEFLLGEAVGINGNGGTSRLFPCPCYYTVSSRLDVGTAAGRGTKHSRESNFRHIFIYFYISRWRGSTIWNTYYLGFLGASDIFYQRSNEYSNVHWLSIGHSQPRRSLIAPILDQQQHLEHYIKRHIFANTWWRVYSGQWCSPTLNLAVCVSSIPLLPP